MKILKYKKGTEKLFSKAVSEYSWEYARLLQVTWQEAYTINAEKEQPDENLIKTLTVQYLSTRMMITGACRHKILYTFYVQHTYYLSSSHLVSPAVDDDFAICRNACVDRCLYCQADI